MNNSQQRQFMALAIRLAKKGLYTTDPNPRVGCVIVKDNQIVGKGWHKRAGDGHAEKNALHQAGEKAVGASVYVTLEPCCHHGKTPPCSDALINAKVASVTAAMLDPNPLVSGKGLQQLAAAGIKTSHGLLQAEAEQLNPGFLMRMRNQRPFIRSKIAMSLDGRTAMANGESKWITGVDARRDVHRIRARSSAILTGINTVLADDPSLNARLENTECIQPIRVILDTQLRTPVDAKLLSLDGEILIFSVNDDSTRIKQLEEAGAEVILQKSVANKLDLHQVIALLNERQINELMIEAGAGVNGAFLEAELIDELLIYMAPQIFGDKARGLFALPAVKSMKDKYSVNISDVRAIGIDWRINANVSY